MLVKFFAKLNAKLNGAIEHNQSLLCAPLDPDLETWPKPYGSWEIPSSRLGGLQECLQFLLAETVDLVFDF